MTVYDRSVREAACGLFDRGAGYKSAARRLGVPPKAVRKWQQTYRAVGRDGLLAMGKTKRSYDHETKVAAAIMMFSLSSRILGIFAMAFSTVKMFRRIPAGLASLRAADFISSFAAASSTKMMR